MFKAISMHTKPSKHTKNMQILTNYIKTTLKKHDFFKISYKCLIMENKVRNFHSHILHAPSYGCFLPF